MADGITILNLGAGGNVMDEELVVYPTAPTDRLRARIVVAGSGIGEISRVIDSEPTGSEHGLVTRNIPTGEQAVKIPGTQVLEFGAITSIAMNTETPIVTYTVPASQTFHLKGFLVSGNVDATYRLYLDGTLKMLFRTSVAAPTASQPLYSEPMVNTGATVEVRAEHSHSGINADFESSVMGYLI